MSNRIAIEKIDTLIEIIENKDGKSSKIMEDRFGPPMLVALNIIRKNIGTDYVDMDDLL